MLAPYAKHGQHARLKTPQAPAPTHDEIMLAFAQEVLKYEAAQVNIHFAFIGSTTPCPCDDCNHIEIYPPTFSLRAREEIRKAAQREAQERLAAEMLASASAQGNRKPGQDADFRLIDRVDGAIRYGRFIEMMAEQEQNEVAA